MTEENRIKKLAVSLKDLYDTVITRKLKYKTQDGIAAIFNPNINQIIASKKATLKANEVLETDISENNTLKKKSVIQQESIEREKAMQHHREKLVLKKFNTKHKNKKTQLTFSDLQSLYINPKK